MPKSYEFKAPKVEHNRNLTGALPSGFDPEMLPDPREGFMLGLVARRGSGKSFCIYNLLSNFYKGCFDKVYIFNPSYGNDMTLSPESLDLPEESFYDKVDVDFIEGVIDSQIAQKKQYDAGKLKKKHLDRILLVFDDCISDPNFVSNRNANIMNKLAFKGRHLRMNCILSSQSYNAGMSKRLRTNVPNWIFFRTDNTKERKSIIEEQGGICDEKKFEEMFDYATKEPHDFFYIYGSCPNKEAKFRRNIDNIIEYKN
tara:strand:+ start:976 stop:1743 length:768 start_codon:yes stop_codon:yes gene_type:complete